MSKIKVGRIKRPKRPPTEARSVARKISELYDGGRGSPFVPAREEALLAKGFKEEEVPLGVANEVRSEACRELARRSNAVQRAKRKKELLDKLHVPMFPPPD